MAGPLASASNEFVHIGRVTTVNCILIPNTGLIVQTYSGKVESFLADIVRMKGIACCRTYFELEPTGNKVVQCCAIRTIIEVM